MEVYHAWQTIVKNLISEPAEFCAPVLAHDTICITVRHAHPSSYEGRHKSKASFARPA